MLMSASFPSKPLVCSERAVNSLTKALLPRKSKIKPKQYPDDGGQNSADRREGFCSDYNAAGRNTGVGLQLLSLHC